MELMIVPSPRGWRSRRRWILVAGLVVAVVAATAVGVAITSSPSSASVYTGTLTRDDRSQVHSITVDDRARLTAVLEFEADPPFSGARQVTASVAVRTSTGRQVAGTFGGSPTKVSVDVDAGSYDLVVSTRWPLVLRDIDYTLTVTTDDAPPSPSASPTDEPPTTQPTASPTQPSPTRSTTRPPSPTGEPVTPTPTASSSAPPTDPPATGNIAAACGTWVLYQVTDAADLEQQRSHIEDALALPGVVGFSVRFPWDAADLTGGQRTVPLLDTAADIADRAGKALSIRFMAGAHTPQRVFDAGASFYLLNGQRVPLPFDNATGRHQVFVDAYADYAGRLADWSRSHGVRLLHLSWYGQDWAELNNGAEVRDAPGYSEQAWLDGHRELIDVGVRLSSKDLAVELPLSGYGPLSSGESAALASYVVDRLGPDNDRFFIQANGWDEAREWGSPDQPVEAQFDRIWEQQLVRGLQMIQPDGYDWARVYDRLVEVDATYGEVYLPSFWQVPGPSAAFSNNTPGRITELEKEIARFADSRCR